MTPAFSNASLSLSISVRRRSAGAAPAPQTSVPLMMTITRISLLVRRGLWSGPSRLDQWTLYLRVE
jgi:hypothetical protein